MPYAYALIWCNGGGGRHLLVATKRFTSTRFGGAPVAPPRLLHGAGQACFPGGQVNPGEAAQAAALREFLEETGVDLTTPAAVATYHVAHQHVIAGAGFSTLYVQLTALADLNQLAADINLNIGNNTPADQELAQVQVVAEAAAAALFGPSPLIPVGGWYGPPRMAQLAGAFQVHHGHAWHAVAAGMVPPPIRQFVTNELNAAFNWHVAGVANLPVAAAAAPVVAAVLGGAPVVAVPPVLPPVVAGPPPVVPGAHLGWARQHAYFLAAVVALGLAVAVVMMRRIYPDYTPR